MSTNLPLNDDELEAKPIWATHYFKNESGHVLFESVDYWQWFIGGNLTDKFKQTHGINYASTLIEGSK